MIAMDTFWVYLNGRLVEVYKEEAAGKYRAVNPKDFNGVIYRGPNKVFEKKPELKNSLEKQ